MTTNIDQKTTGSQSPIILGDNNEIQYGNKTKLANEVNTMLQVINLIPEVARERGVSSDTIEYPKDFLKKIEDRFSDYKLPLKARFGNLDVLYRSSYEEARKNSGIDEFSLEEMCSYLRNLSIQVLTENNNNPIEGLKFLCDLFHQKFSNGDINFSSEAIEYFLYKQLVECNVFPNPIE
jgi:hypothetical protein